MLRLKQQWSLHFCAAVARGSANPDWVCCSGQCEQSARPCRRAGVCSISKPPSQIQAFLAPVKLSDNLWAGTVPCKQMDVNGPAAKSLGCSSGRGEREQSSSVLMPRCPSLLRLPWDEQAGEVSGLGTGCFTAEMIPPALPLIPVTPSPRTRWFLRCFQPELPFHWEQPSPCAVLLSSRDSPWRQQRSIFCFNCLGAVVSYERLALARSESWDKRIKTASSRLHRNCRKGFL